MIKALWFGVYFFALYAIIVAGTLVISIVTEFISNDQLSFGFCLTKKCISVVSEHFGDTFDLYKTLFYMIVPLAGLFAGIVGLNTYKLAVSNSVMNNHVSNFKLFCDFIDRELDKRKLINSDDVDYFTMYLFVFPKSKYGNFNDFGCYKNKIKKINNVIISSNQSYLDLSGKVSVKKSPFNYRYHQYEMKEVLTDIGVNISLNHRNAFSEVEEQVLDLIKVIGKSFVDECEYIDVQERKYR